MLAYRFGVAGCQVSPNMPPMSISNEPIMNPNMVGKAITDATRTRVDPVRILLRSEVFIHRAPSTPRPITVAVSATERGDQKNPADQGPTIIQGPIIPGPQEPLVQP